MYIKALYPFSARNSFSLLLLLFARPKQKFQTLKTVHVSSHKGSLGDRGFKLQNVREMSHDIIMTITDPFTNASYWAGSLDETSEKHPAGDK